MRLVGKRTMGRIWMDTSLVDMKFMDDSFMDSPFVDKEIVGHEKHGRHVNQMLQERHRLRCMLNVINVDFRQSKTIFQMLKRRYNKNYNVNIHSMLKTKSKPN